MRGAQEGVVKLLKAICSLCGAGIVFSAAAVLAADYPPDVMIRSVSVIRGERTAKRVYVGEPVVLEAQVVSLSEWTVDKAAVVFRTPEGENLGTREITLAPGESNRLMVPYSFFMRGEQQVSAHVLIDGRPYLRPGPYLTKTSISVLDPGIDLAVGRLVIKQNGPMIHTVAAGRPFRLELEVINRSDVPVNPFHVVFGYGKFSGDLAGSFDPPVYVDGLGPYGRKIARLTVDEMPKGKWFVAGEVIPPGAAADAVPGNNRRSTVIAVRSVKQTS